MTAESATIIT